MDNIGYTCFVIYDYNKDSIPDIIYRSGQTEIGGANLLANYLWVMYGERQAIATTAPNTLSNKNEVHFSVLKEKQLKVHRTHNYPIETEIYSLQGKVINRISLPSGSNHCDLSNLSAGVIFFRYTQGKISENATAIIPFPGLLKTWKHSLSVAT